MQSAHDPRSRNALKKVRVALMPVASKMRWQAVNVGLHWFVYALITVMMVVYASGVSRRALR